jgi:hypothetical protein
MVMGYRLEIQGSIPNKGRDFPLLHGAQTGPGAHPASYPVSTGDSSQGVEVAGEVKLTIHLHVVPMSRMMELYLHSLTCLYGIMIN